MGNVIRAIVLLFMLVSPGLAKDTTNTAAASGCLGGCFGFVLLIIVFNIMLLFWVATDFKKRSGSTSIGWILFILVFGLIGLIIYLMARPSGSLGECPNCHNEKIIHMPICPHCGKKVIE